MDITALLSMSFMPCAGGFPDVCGTDLFDASVVAHCWQGELSIQAGCYLLVKCCCNLSGGLLMPGCEAGLRACAFCCRAQGARVVSMVVGPAGLRCQALARAAGLSI